MLNLLKWWKPVLGALLLISSLSGIIYYQNKTYHTLLQDQSKLQMRLEASQNALEAFAKDKVITESTLVEHAKKRSQVELENNKLMKELQRLKNESKDKCLVAPVDPHILDRL